MFWVILHFAKSSFLLQELYAVLCHVLSALTHHSPLATALKRHPDRLVDKLRKIRDDVARRAEVKQKQITNKLREQHARKLAK